MKPFIHAYREIAGELIRNSSQDSVITPKNVYQEGRETNKPIIKEVVTQLLLPGSGIEGFENLVELYRLSLQGHSCLLLVEHYSNFDLPNFHELLDRRGPEGEAIVKAMIAIAGMKLNQENDLVRAFTEAFTRIVIFPSSALKGITDPEKLKEAKNHRMSINMAALWQIMRLKTKGRIILVFPTGQRFRPWDPKTGRGLTEVYPYVKTFHYMALVAVNGNTLCINPNGKMDEDLAAEDVVTYTVSPVYHCKDYRAEVLHEDKHVKDPKQYLMDHIMAELAVMHEAAEKKRLPLLTALGREPH